jgi:hypothetical protein
MKWCIFVNRRCCGEDCSGWVRDNCFIHLLLPNDYNDKKLQAELDWSKYESSRTAGHNLMENSDDQLSFLDEIERLIAQHQ